MSIQSDWEEDGERTWDVMRAIDYILSIPQVDPEKLMLTGRVSFFHPPKENISHFCNFYCTGLSMGGEVTTITGAMDERIKFVIPFGYSPDLNVMRYHGNHPCWRFMNSNVREYFDAATWDIDRFQILH